MLAVVVQQPLYSSDQMHKLARVFILYLGTFPCDLNYVLAILFFYSLNLPMQYSQALKDFVTFLNL